MIWTNFKTYVPYQGWEIVLPGWGGEFQPDVLSVSSEMQVPYP